VAGALRAWAHAAAGSLRSSELEGGASATLGGIDLSATLSREASDGVSAIRPGDRFGLYNPDRDGFARRSANLRAGVSVAPGHRIGASITGTRLNSQYDGSQFLAPDFLSDATPDFRTRLATSVGAIDYRGELTPAWTTTLQATTQRDDMVGGADVTSRFLTHRRGLTWQNAWSVGAAHRLVGAIERVEESAESSEFAAEVSRRTTAVVLGYTGSFGAQRVQADIRHDRNTSYGGRTTGKLGWSIEFQPGLTLRAVAGTAFRAPTFNDLYFPGFGVPDGPFAPRPERARSFEAGLQWKDAASSASFTVYQNRVRDLIGYQPDRTFCPAGPAYDFGCAGNVSRARLLGATLEGTRRLGEFAVRAAIDLLDAKNADTGARLTRRAAHQESVSLDWARGAWSASAAVVAVGARPEGGAMLASYQTLDLQARWRFAPGWRAEVRLQNALDRRYEPALDYQSTGRIGWLGLRYDSEGL
jgi:vitamin B12 transporter